MPSYGSIRCCYLGSHTRGRVRGVTPEEPAAGNLHGGIREGGDLRRAMVDLSGHEAGNGGYSQREPKAHWVSSTRSDHSSADRARSLRKQERALVNPDRQEPLRSIGHHFRSWVLSLRAPPLRLLSSLLGAPCGTTMTRINLAQNPFLNQEAT